jgi:hypothetical protein
VDAANSPINLQSGFHLHPSSEWAHLEVIVKYIHFQCAGVLILGSLFAAGQSVRASSAGKLPSAPYQPITQRQRLNWILDDTIGPETLTVGLFSAGIGTARDAPHEYGPHWGGFGDRYGMRLTGVSTGNVMEAELGALWGEDPRYRYFRGPGEPLKDRIRHVVVMTFAAHNRHGNLMPAYARYVATPGNNFLSNTWRVNSEATNQAAILRTVWGFAGLMGKNAFTEFGPDLKRLLFRTNN